MNAEQVRLLKSLMSCVHFIRDQYGVDDYLGSMGVSTFQNECSAFQLYSPSTEIAELMKEVVQRFIVPPRIWVYNELGVTRPHWFEIDQLGSTSGVFNSKSGCHRLGNINVRATRVMCP